MAGQIPGLQEKDLRLIVTGGRMALQIYLNGRWDHVYIKRSRSIPPGVYTLSEAVQSELGKAYKGPVLALYDGFLYQATRSGVVKHSDIALSGATLPEVETFATISYTQNPPMIEKMGNKEISALKSSS